MTFQELLDLARERNGLSTDDLLAALLPLFRQVAGCHEEGRVAPLRGVDHLVVDDQYRVTFAPGTSRAPVRADRRVADVQRAASRAFEIVGRAEATADLLAGTAEVRSLDVLSDGDEVTHPVLVAGWETWERRVGHHDELTDIASLGMLLVALAGGLDFGLRDDVEALAPVRTNLFAIAPSLHPVVAQVATRMIELDRHQRSQDLHSIIERLETYRDQPIDLDLSEVAADEAPGGLRAAILTTLRDRLFDLSRRNRLIWFRSSMQSLNLTEASVPLMLDARNIRPDQLFTWNGRVARQVLSLRPVSLGTVIRWEDAPYSNGTLDTLISQARRDRQEYGQAQLRLVIAFLRWHDLKGEPEQRISSPMVLLPVQITKRRGIRDSYLLQAESAEAEVNPALRQYLKQLYDLDLPAVIDLEHESLVDLQARLRSEIQRSEPAVELRLQERPRIELIHSRALIRLESFQRRASRGSVTVGRRAYAYSYRRRDFRPLGLQVFLDRVALRPAPITSAMGAPPAPRMPSMAPAITVKKDMYALDDSGGGNPYVWDFDLCSLTLANFNYRTMSLVRDYRDLIGGRGSSESFERLFSLEPRPVVESPATDLPIADRYLVVPADGSQVAAIARAGRGESLVIQGPPGTGKSQTITNLIADYVARGKRVLFVCQKRAAIDVVHSRLRQRGLEELACLIHDSQADKKAFVQRLRGTYEAWLGSGPAVEMSEGRRERVMGRIAVAVAEVEAFESSTAERLGDRGPTLRQVIERLIDSRAQRWGDQLPVELRRFIPAPEAWWAARPIVDQVSRALATGGSDPRLALSPLRFVARPVLDSVRADAELASAAPRVAIQLRAVLEAFEDAGVDTAITLASAVRIGDLAGFALPLARLGRASVLRRSSPFTETLRSDLRLWKGVQSDLEKARKASAGWKDPLTPEDARAALQIAEAKERSLLRFLDSNWRRVNAAVRRGFQQGPRAVPIAASEALRRLVAVDDAEKALEVAATNAREQWGYADLGDLAASIEALRRPDDAAVATWRDRLADADDDDLAGALADARTDLERARTTLAGVIEDVDDVPLDQVVAILDSLSDPALGPVVRGVAPGLRALVDHPEIARAVRRFSASPDEIEFAVCAAALDDAVARRPTVASFTGARLAEQILRIQTLLPELYEADAAVIVGRVRARFLDDIAHSGRSVTGMSADGRERKKTWTTGRRELENEFRKVMRYRSIRDLASGETGAVVAALRPIWLMSPTSVSDTLPLDPDLFDVVVYDEASQIPVEEAVPAMHRANQVVVVGDRMQLPPTRFFTAKSDLVDDPDDDLEVGVVLDGDSFLAQSAGRLPSTMLTWHYRSRYEALIGFSNAAFYEGRLATIPDRVPAVEARPEIAIDLRDGAEIGEADGRSGVDGLLGRPISFHRLRGSAYEHRTNPAEAAYVAQLVRDLLGRGTGLTVGIVAFSEAQQTEIERALEALAHADPEFATLYEAELTREEDDQVVGLFVKNLENVQGDERDVILMSVCYGPDVDGRMVMNFGPINQEGGEKRLNVIFSRARVHMAIVSSIDADMITNTYNDGANTLRRFLDYAAAVSTGDVSRAMSVMAGFRERPGRDAVGTHATVPVVSQLASALRSKGLVVVERVGQSAFRIDLAVRRPGDDQHRVAVLVDHEDRVAAQPLDERVVNHPGVLRSAGWRVVPVVSKEWFEDPTTVLEAIERTLEGDDAADEALVAQVLRELDESPVEAVVAQRTATDPGAPPHAPGSTRTEVDIQRRPTSNQLAGQSVCFTGGSICSINGVRLMRDDQERLATQAGLDVRQSVSARLDLLVLANPDSQSSKTRRAVDLGVRRIAEPAFWRMVGVEIDGPE